MSDQTPTHEERAKRRAQLARLLNSIHQRGGIPRDLDDVIHDLDTTGAAAAGTTRDGLTVGLFNPGAHHVGQCITLPGGDRPGSDPRRIIYACPACGGLYLNRPPRDMQPGEILPLPEAVRPCAKCADTLEIIGAAEALEKLERLAAAELAALPPRQHEHELNQKRRNHRHDRIQRPQPYFET